MSAPVQAKTEEELYLRVQNYAKGYKKFEGKSDEQIQTEMKEFEQLPMPSLTDLQQTIEEMGGKLDQIISPLLILQGYLDDALYKENAQIIYNHVSTEEKQLKRYEQSEHIITLDKERETVYEDVYTFLDSLDW